MSQDECLVIAEAGVNHNGDPDLAMQLAATAAASGADFIKFQTFKAKSVVSRQAPKAQYQLEKTGSSETQFEMLERLELSYNLHRELIDECKKQGIDFLSTPCDVDSLHFLTEDLGLKVVKLGSGELDNAPLLYEAAKSNVQIILSTGMGTLGEIETALGILALGMTENGPSPSPQAFRDILFDPASWHKLQARVQLLHCTTEYPAAVAQTNLRAMKTIEQAFGLGTGYSDHTNGLSVSLAAVAMGATIIEKHFTLDRNLSGPDHAASLEPAELKSLVDGIRDIELAKGIAIKQPSPPEVANRSIVRKSLVAASPVKKGEMISAHHIAIKRPGTGMSPLHYWDLIGKVASKEYTYESLFDEDI